MVFFLQILPNLSIQTIWFWNKGTNRVRFWSLFMSMLFHLFPGDNLEVDIHA